jgi:hypothetical protein
MPLGPGGAEGTVRDKAGVGLSITAEAGGAVDVHSITISGEWAKHEDGGDGCCCCGGMPGGGRCSSQWSLQLILQKANHSIIINTRAL